MQTLTYYVYLPNIGEHLDINGIGFIVNNYENITPPHDRIIIKNVNSGEFTRLVLVNGKWKPDDGNVYTVNFHGIVPVKEETILTTGQTNDMIRNNILQQNVQKGIFYSADRAPGSTRKLGTTTPYPFSVVKTINPSKVIVDFGPNFPPYIYSVTTINNAGIAVPTDNGGIRTLTKRQDNTWAFMGRKLYSGDMIEFA